MKMTENGLLKKVTEVFIVEALSYTEAERRFVQEMESYASAGFEVAGIKRTTISELFESTDAAADRWYKVKLSYLTLDEKTGAEKRYNSLVLVQATEFEDAIKTLKEGMKGTLGDWIIVAVSETPILDIYHYEPSEENRED